MTYKMELINLEKSYNNVKVLKKLNLNVNQGEFLVILGPSGEGKSTLLRTIVNIEPLDKGKVIVDGKDVTNQPPNKRNIAMVFQNYALYPNMTVYENIAFPLKMGRMNKSTIKTKIDEIASLLKIEDILNKNATKLSGGQKQRVAIARALVRDPALFLLDEPLSNLDARVRYTSRQELKRLQRELNYTFIYVTHDQLEASNLADRVAVLHNGVIEQIGRYDELYEKPVTRWVGDFIGTYPMNFIDGDILGYPGKTVGFRSIWAKPGDKIKAKVNLIENAEGNYYIHCNINDTNIVIRTKEKYAIGDDIYFDLIKFNIYKDNLLEDVVVPEDYNSEPS
ncbi:ABC transporter ATP-binding protein [Ferroplasma acidiphilum]|jgi:ABC-type sugar transport system ATPase subunit|uniref:ABC transporter ATP-binding protein n=1 Tax=Ferroplasma acidiphilum TaxID=74969 RepID=UPI0023F01F06|nr:ABC transporter ATP-binding protein [Ferroplasma acidiphilum]